jgi:hypothetical protein
MKPFTRLPGRIANENKPRANWGRIVTGLGNNREIMRNISRDNKNRRAKLDLV